MAEEIGDLIGAEKSKGGGVLESIDPVSGRKVYTPEKFSAEGLTFGSPRAAERAASMSVEEATKLSRSPDRTREKPKGMPEYNLGEPLKEHPKPAWVKHAEVATGSPYAFDEEKKKWVQGTTLQPTRENPQSPAPVR